MIQVKETHNTVRAWELFQEGRYTEIMREFEGADIQDLRDLHALACMESGQIVTAAAGNGIFSPLVNAFLARKANRHTEAARLLGSWLEKHEFNSHSILNAFLESAAQAEEWGIVTKVFGKFKDRKVYGNLVIPALFEASYRTAKFSDCLELFENYREHFADGRMLQKAAVAMIHTGRFKDGERILVALYEKISGTRYELNYEAVKRGYESDIKNIPAMEKKKSRSQEETMRLGMAYLFSGRYDRALSTFESISK